MSFKTPQPGKVRHRGGDDALFVPASVPAVSPLPLFKGQSSVADSGFTRHLLNFQKLKHLEQSYISLMWTAR